MYRLRPLAGLLAESSRRLLTGPSTNIAAAVCAASDVFKSTPSLTVQFSRGLHYTWAASHDVEAKPDYNPALFSEPPRKYRSLADKELWHEAWMYEDRFGSETDPILVPSLEDERIIGVTDPEDESLIVWGILKAEEPPRQFIEGGEFYVLKVVPRVMKVGDALLEMEGAGGQTPLAA